MQPSSVFANKTAALVAADVSFLAAATLNKIHLASATFTPSLTLTLANLTEATFPGYAALVGGGTGTQFNFFDPATGNSVVEVKAPAGGWIFNTSGTTGLPQTVYGYYLTDNGSATLIGSALLPAPVTLNATNQYIEIPPVRFTFPPSPMT